MGYLGVVVLLIAGGTLLGMVPGTRAIASWLTIGACFVLDGLLERSAAIAATGGATLIAAVAAYALDLAQLGLVLEIVTNCRAGIIEMRMTGTANTTLMSSR